MREPLSFFVAGIPKGQPRVKAFSRGKHAGVYDPGTSDGWKLLIRHEAKKAWDGVQWEGPLRVAITIYFPRPKSHFKTGKNAHVLRENAPIWHTSKPDRDNCDKAIMDALTNLGVWKDDSQACDGPVRKKYVTGNQSAGAQITIGEAW